MGNLEYCGQTAGCLRFSMKPLTRVVWSIVLALPLLHWALPAHAVEPSQASRSVTVDFGREVRPLLAEYCYQCHSQDEAKGRFRLDDKRQVFGKLHSGEIGIVPGKPQESEVFRRITEKDASAACPPPG